MSGFEISIVISAKNDNGGVDVYTAPLWVNSADLRKLDLFIHDGNNAPIDIQKYTVDSDNNISNPETISDRLNGVYNSVIKQTSKQMTGSGKKRRKTRKRTLK